MSEQEPTELEELRAFKENAISLLRSTSNAVMHLLPLAKGYAPENQSETAKKTCNGHIEAGEGALLAARDFLSDLDT
jgi:hypothetical protein